MAVALWRRRESFCFWAAVHLLGCRWSLAHRRGTNSTNIVVGDATSKSAYFKGFRGSSIRALAGWEQQLHELFGPRQGGVDSFVNAAK